MTDRHYRAVSSVYRAPGPVPPEVPPDCQCWLSPENRDALAFLGGPICNDACRYYRERHPEMLVRDRRGMTRWSAEAVRLKQEV